MSVPICFIAVTHIHQLKKLVAGINEHIENVEEDGEESFRDRQEFIDYLREAEVLHTDLQSSSEIMAQVRGGKKIIPTFTLTWLA